MNSRVQEVLEVIKGLNALELSELVKGIEVTFGVSAAMPVMAGGFAAPAEEVEKKEEKTEFTVKMTASGSDKIKVIKVLRVVLPGLGLKEAKVLTEDESLPAVIKESVKKDEAEKIKKELEEAGATVQLV